jgi:hypothetical protein
MTGSPTCDLFTILDWRKSEKLARCDVCDQLEEAHEQPGRRRLSGAQVEEARRNLLIADFERQEQHRLQRERNGESGGTAQE